MKQHTYIHSSNLNPHPFHITIVPIHYLKHYFYTHTQQYYKHLISEAVMDSCCTSTEPSNTFLPWRIQNQFHPFSPNYRIVIYLALHNLVTDTNINFTLRVFMKLITHLRYCSFPFPPVTWPAPSHKQCYLSKFTVCQLLQFSYPTHPPPQSVHLEKTCQKITHILVKIRHKNIKEHCLQKCVS